MSIALKRLFGVFDDFAGLEVGVTLFQESVCRCTFFSGVEVFLATQPGTGE